MADVLPILISPTLSGVIVVSGSYMAVRVLVARLEDRLNHIANRLDSRETRIQRLEAPYFDGNHNHQRRLLYLYCVC
jgi:hypothetical protein